MGKRDVFTKILAITGSVLVWLPILAPLIFGLIALIQRGRFLFDYLMPAELFPVVLAGGVLLLWAAFRARLEKRLIGWGLGIAVGILVIGQVLAVVTGLASGEREAVGIWWILVLASLAVYSLAVIVIGIGGVRLVRGLYKALR